jgi:hypothetical protein
MSTRDANATSMMLAISVRLLHLPRFKALPSPYFLAAQFYQQKRNSVSADMARHQHTDPAIREFFRDSGFDKIAARFCTSRGQPRRSLVRLTSRVS